MLCYAGFYSRHIESFLPVSGGRVSIPVVLLVSSPTLQYLQAASCLIIRTTHSRPNPNSYSNYQHPVATKSCSESPLVRQLITRTNRNRIATARGPWWSEWPNISRILSPCSRVSRWCFSQWWSHGCSSAAITDSPFCEKPWASLPFPPSPVPRHRATRSQDPRDPRNQRGGGDIPVGRRDDREVRARVWPLEGTIFFAHQQ